LSIIASHPDGEICVSDLTPEVVVTHSTISHHLRALRMAGLIDYERRSYWVYYRAVPEAMRMLSQLLAVDEAR
jgi:ArsR family transcriptional regulator